MNQPRVFLMCAALGAACAGSAAAQVAGPNGAVEFTLRGGVEAKPEYFGSEDLAYGPDLGLSDFYLRFRGTEFGGGPDTGFGLRGSLRYIPGRDPDDYPELAGLEEVDPALELGFGLGYTAPAFEAFADLRYGFIGHESFVGELGADAVFRPSDRLTMRFGPRVLLGSEDYADTYFGVTPAEAAASGGSFRSFDAEGGAMTAGVELGMTYEIDENWGLDGAVVYEQFVGSAADSPIVEQGSDEQVSIRLGVTRNISFGF